ncbi:PREDICTED: high affinity nitrate transporter 2.7-like isoform X2 [Camelina sativa]|uniref:High affinity nitrate transporter 2.7-like isoform X2 n=1 Tax=Camelina sativa TaxID=90675 RepID=A0ABM0T2W5_CAMSA|nr:PREDICTED: high affinity nitrate transporter 2.7-like isoform X2 [Camelina sativa]
MEPSQPSLSHTTVPVDSDGRATVFRPFSLSSPHSRAFHLAWLSLFSCFFSTFSIPPLVPVISSDLNLSESTVSAAGIASFVGSIFSRLAMGPLCDLIGPRTSSAILSFLTAPAILSAAFISSPTSFILLRFFVGFSLANFVANQYWMSSMFSGNVIGLANGVSAGWANVGAGISQLLMPLIYSTVAEFFPRAFAWRVSFVFPAVFQVTTAVLVLLYGQDTPSGNRETSKQNKIRTPEGDKGEGEHSNFVEILIGGLGNYRAWVLALLYGYSYGVELTTDNVIAGYFYERFGVNLEAAGTIAASFGISNIASRPAGGMISDALGKRFGMRGRLWGLWVVQSVAGLLCVLLGRVNSLWGSIAVMWVFSVFVQAASGLVFGVVPFVSSRSLGMVAGITGSGGTVGAVVTQYLLFSGDGVRKQRSISLMGLMMFVFSLSVTSIYFPRWGGMCCGPSSSSSGSEDVSRRLLDDDEEEDGKVRSGILRPVC